jgi:hypothetical protein
MVYKAVPIPSMKRVVSREDSILGIAERSTLFLTSEAEEETKKKRRDKILFINSEIDRRKTAFEIV